MKNIRHLLWIPAGTAVGFGVAFLLGDNPGIPVDLYYFTYFLAIGGFFSFYVWYTDLRLPEWMKRRLGRGIVLGVVVGAVMIQNVLSRPETDQLHGMSLASAVLWRGVIYGGIDGILLFTFPWIVTWRALEGERRSLVGKVTVSAVAWIAILVVTTGYHLGYRDFRSEMILQPNIGSTIAAVPTLLAANPVASPLTHIFLHVAAVVHSPNSPLFLPPHRR